MSDKDKALIPFDERSLTIVGRQISIAEKILQESRNAFSALETKPPKTFTNSIGMTFVLIPAGTFIMGSPESEEGRTDDEIQHQVTISRAFYMQTTPVVQGQWKKIMGCIPSDYDDYPVYKVGDDYPVTWISMYDIRAFIRKLNRHEGTDNYRRPTEAEWEYACRAGSVTAYYFGDNAQDLKDYGWFTDNSNHNHHPVGKKRPNVWGLYDMHGNVAEWVQDWYSGYSSDHVTDPNGHLLGRFRVTRSGSWQSDATDCRAARRLLWHPPFGLGFLGFRVARTLDRGSNKSNEMPILEVMGKQLGEKNQYAKPIPEFDSTITEIGRDGWFIIYSDGTFLRL